MQIRSAKIEAFLKSFVFSVLLFLVWGFFSLSRGRALLRNFGWVELLWFAYNTVIAALFLIRTRPSVVSMDLVHWSVALVTSFSGFLFVREGIDRPVASVVGQSVVVLGLVPAILTACTLARSYDVLPALRVVKTRGLYAIVRHPMYASSLVIKLGYVVKYPSAFNVLLLIAVAILYDRRARYEEGILSRSEAYIHYMQQVRRRFVPGIY